MKNYFVWLFMASVCLSYSVTNKADECLNSGLKQGLGAREYTRLRCN